MDWKQQWIDKVLEKVPEGGYRERAQAELCDHLETQYRALMEAGRTRDEARAEALRVMGTPEALREEYLAAWRRTWPARLEELGWRVLAWAGGVPIMFWVHGLAAIAINAAYNVVYGMVISLLGNTPDPWEIAVRLDRSMFFSGLLPLLCAWSAGAFFLSLMFRFRRARRPAVLISVGLFAHWAHVEAIGVWFEALDDHRTFWEELVLDLRFNAGFHFLALALGILLGVLFGHLSEKMGRSAAARRDLIIV